MEGLGPKYTLVFWYDQLETLLPSAKEIVLPQLNAAILQNLVKADAGRVHV